MMPSLPPEHAHSIPMAGDMHHAQFFPTKECGFIPGTPVFDVRLKLYQENSLFLNNLVQAEKVHEFRNPKDFDQRTGGIFRSIYAWEDPTDCQQALISVQVALTCGMESSIDKILSGNKPQKLPDTAIFYSISSWDRPTDEKELGKRLILTVADHLQKTEPHIRHFATLSPMTGFRKWTQGLRPADVERMTKTHVSIAQEFCAAAREMTIRAHMQEYPGFVELYKQVAATYLTTGTRTKTRFAVNDRVAHFHLNNGAYVGRINEAANLMPYGFDESYGLMVNYIYRPKACPANAEAYRTGNVSRADNVHRLIFS